MASTTSYQLPSKIERCMAALSKLYAQEGKRPLQNIIVNAKIFVEEGYSYDNWNGGTSGHAIRLTVPEEIYLANINQQAEVQRQISEDLNKLHNVQNEFFDGVFLEMDLPEESNWRQESGLLVTGTRQVGTEAAKRIWTENDFRLFFSHKTEVKRETAAVKEALRHYGVSAFVAHEDIHPTKEWQDEIENALATMDGFVALMTKEFHESNWTDQEVGYALARGVPIVAVRLERDPYGFLGKFQGLTTDWASMPEELVKLLIKSDRMLSAYIGALSRCSSFDRGNALSLILPAIDAVSDDQIDRIIDAYNTNTELQGSFGFSGTKPFSWGPGILPHLHRWGSRKFVMSSNWPRRIEPDF
ncbi:MULTISPECIES: toll/interleukin-1 receptor domain-containing protein [unclassified Afipia]|uniref:toll/interleukin-1 receptor domain-containing protein n=1 Tax=unclassified Afipia TaxID=2642050 RepID=UPI0018C93CF5|nr:MULTISPECIES: toll/interleukin-1 receptor domain-containing protein [unclassified Afipia]